MTDETNNANAGANRIAQVDQHWHSKHGETIYRGMVGGVENLMTRRDDAHVTGADPVSQMELAQRLMRPDDNGRVENDALASSDEATWRAFRDGLPDRKRWRDRTR